MTYRPRLTCSGRLPTRRPLVANIEAWNQRVIRAIGIQKPAKPSLMMPPEPTQAIRPLKDQTKPPGEVIRIGAVRLAASRPDLT